MTEFPAVSLVQVSKVVFSLYVIPGKQNEESEQAVNAENS